MKKRILCAVLTALLLVSLVPVSALGATVVLSPQKLSVNGAEYECEKYNIDGYNYFKLRDLGMLLSGTASQFWVGWVQETSTVSIVTGAGYEANGSELVVGADKSGEAVPSAQTIMINGVTRSDLSVYNIGGNNFFKLAELGSALGFNVSYRGETNTAVVTSVDYTPAAAPVRLSLKYSGGGHTNDNEGLWYIEERAATSSPCDDVDGDGKKEIIFAVRNIFCLDAATGNIKWMTPYGHDTSERGLSSANAIAIGNQYVPTQIVDLDGDGTKEIVTVGINSSTDTGCLGVYDGNGRFKWPLITTSYAIRAMKIADLDNDGKMEVAILLGVGENYRYTSDPALYVYNSDGSLRAGFPQEFGYGTFGNSIEAVDMDGDGQLELVMLGDQCWMGAFRADGTKITIGSGPYSGKTWEQVIDFEDYEFTKNFATGKVTEYSQGRGGNYAVMGSRSGIVAADVDGDGKTELVATALINDQKMNDDIMGERAMTVEDMLEGGIARYFTAFILNLDHSRYINSNKGFDWSAWPQDVGTILTYDDFFVLPNPDISPDVADLNGDGNMEIVYSSYDGMVHCFSLDGTEHGAWPFNMNAGGGAKTMASKPAVADINGDGLQEVIFMTYTPLNQMAARGRLYVLDYNGNVLAEQELPQGWGKGNGDANYGYPNGGEAAPVIADVDGDGRAEIIATTRNCGVCVYKVG